MSEEKRTPKTKEELEALKKEIIDLYKKIAELTEDERKEIGICSRDPKELTDEELAQVTGGMKTNFKLTLAAIIGFVANGSAGFSFQTVDTTEDSAKG